MDTIRTFEVAVKIGETNVNHITYEKESYIKAANEFKEKFVDKTIAYVDVEYSEYKKNSIVFIDPTAISFYPGLVTDIRLEEGQIDVKINDKYEKYLEEYTPDKYCVGFLMHARLSSGTAEILSIRGATFLPKDCLGKTYIV